MVRTRRRLLQTAGAATVVALAGCAETESTDDSASMDDESMNDSSMNDEESMSGSQTVRVRIENVSDRSFYGSDTHTGGQIWITPGAYAVHTGENPVFTEDESASVGLEALAEAGRAGGFEGEDGLVDELDAMGDDGVAHSGAWTPEDTVEDPNDLTGEVPGAPPIAPGGAFEFNVEVEPGQQFSFATMFVPSNDVFFSPGADGITLWPEDGEVVDGDVTDDIELWDAGTEPNAEPPGEGSDQAPAQDAPDQGDDEGGVVRRLDDVDDGYDYPAVNEAIQVTVTPTEMMDDESMDDEAMDGESMDDGSMDNETMNDSSMDDGSMDNETMDDGS